MVREIIFFLFYYMLGFIVLRHVNSPKTNLYWKLCVRMIQKFFPGKPIVVIDDNSNKEFVDNIGVNLENIKFIKSEFPGRGEILPYYYLARDNLFKKAFIIQDSVFIQKKISSSKLKTKDINFLLSFPSRISNNVDQEVDLLNKLNYGPELTEYYHSREWNGCFGLMSVVKLDFIKYIGQKYNLFNVLNFVSNRNDRMNMERVFAVVCQFENRSIFTNNAILGDLFKYINYHYGYSFDEYTNDVMKKNRNITKKEIVKVWTGR